MIIDSSDMPRESRSRSTVALPGTLSMLQSRQWRLNRLRLRRLRKCHGAGRFRASTSGGCCSIEAGIPRPDRHPIWSIISPFNKCQSGSDLAHLLLVKVHAPLGLLGLFAIRARNPGRAVTSHRKRGRADVAFGLFEQLAHAGIIQTTFRRHG